MHEMNSETEKMLGKALLGADMGDPHYTGMDWGKDASVVQERPSQHRFLHIDAGDVEDVYGICREQGLKVLDVRRAPRKIAEADLIKDAKGNVIGVRKPKRNEVFFVPKVNRYVAKVMEVRS